MKFAPRLWSRERIRFAVALAAICLASVLAVACTSPTGDDDDAPIVFDVVSEHSLTVTPTPEPIEYADLLRYPVRQCGSADPAVDPQLFGFPVANEIHAGLTRFTAYPEAGFELELAASYEVDDAGLRYTFRLRPGIEFSDGSPITAHDFVWSWNRAAGKARIGSSAHTIFAPVVGFAEVAEKWDAEIAGVRAEDVSTLVVDLVRPVAHFPMMLASPVAAVLDRDNARHWDAVWSNNGFAGEMVFDSYTMPTGAGPFKLAEYRFATGTCVLEQNERYWDDSVDVIDRIELAVPEGWKSTYETDGMFRVQNVSDAMELNRAAFDAGEIDVLTPVFPSDADFDDGAVPLVHGVASFLILSPLVPPLNDHDFRLALQHASPEYEFEGNAVSRMLPHSIAMGTSLRGRGAFDAELAASFLSRCDCYDADETPLRYYQWADLPDQVRLPEHFVFESWKDVLGIEALADVDPENDELWDFAMGDLGMRDIEVRPAFPHPSAVLDQVLLAVPGLAESMPHILTLSDKAAREGDAAESARLYLELEQEILDSGLVIPLRGRGTSYAKVKSWVRGLGPTWDGASFFRDVRTVDRP